MHVCISEREIDILTEWEGERGRDYERDSVREREREREREGERYRKIE